MNNVYYLPPEYFQLMVRQTNKRDNILSRAWHKVGYSIMETTVIMMAYLAQKGA